MHISGVLTDTEKRPGTIRIVGGVLGMIISYLLLMFFPDQVIFF